MEQADANIISALITSTQPTINTAISAARTTGVLSRISVEELIELAIELASRAAQARANQLEQQLEAATDELNELQAKLADMTVILGKLSPPADWYITKSALWRQNPTNPGRPTVLARMSHAGVLLIHSPEVWRYLQRVTPLPPAITELRKLHGEDVPTGAMPLVAPIANSFPPKDKS